MSTSISLKEAQAHLSEIVSKLAPGEEVLLIEGQRPVAKLIGEPPGLTKRPDPGLCKGMITIIEDDDEHLRDFAEYMP